MEKITYKIKHKSKWISRDQRIFDEFVFSDPKLIFCPKILMLGINPSAEQNSFCDNTNLCLLNAILHLNAKSTKKIKGYQLMNFSSKVDSDWKTLLDSDYDFNIKLLKRWLKKGKDVCLFYGPNFINTSRKQVKNQLFTQEFKQLIEAHKFQIYITTKQGKFAHPGRKSEVEIEKYNPAIHIIFP